MTIEDLCFLSILPQSDGFVRGGFESKVIDI